MSTRGTFNTGRLYTDGGQRIAWQVLSTGNVVMVDASRLVDYVLVVPDPTNERVLAAYDSVSHSNPGNKQAPFNSAEMTEARALHPMLRAVAHAGQFPPVEVGASPFPIRLSINPSHLEEFRQCEYGAHEDGSTKTPTGFTAYSILNRFKTLIEIRDADEADVIYYAACSGTFGLLGNGETHAEKMRERALNKAANNVADWLRAHAKPETISQWKSADGY